MSTIVNVTERNSLNLSDDTRIVVVIEPTGNSITIENASTNRIDVLSAPIGPQGERGLQGIQGPQGEQGIQGPIGTIGSGIDIEVANITASGFISASGLILGGISPNQVAYFNENYALTGSENFKWNGASLFVTSSINTNILQVNAITASSISSSDNIFTNKLLINTPSVTDDFFLIRSGSMNTLRVNTEGILVLGAYAYVPSAEAGGVYYNQIDNEFYVGKETN